MLEDLHKIPKCYFINNKLPIFSTELNNNKQLKIFDGEERDDVLFFLDKDMYLYSSTTGEKVENIPQMPNFPMALYIAGVLIKHPKYNHHNFPEGFNLYKIGKNIPFSIIHEYDYVLSVKSNLRLSSQSTVKKYYKDNSDICYSTLTSTSMSTPISNVSEFLLKVLNNEEPTYLHNSYGPYIWKDLYEGCLAIAFPTENNSSLNQFLLDDKMRLRTRFDNKIINGIVQPKSLSEALYTSAVLVQHPDFKEPIFTAKYKPELKKWFQVNGLGKLSLTEAIEKAKEFSCYTNKHLEYKLFDADYNFHSSISEGTEFNNDTVCQLRLQVNKLPEEYLSNSPEIPKISKCYDNERVMLATSRGSTGIIHAELDINMRLWSRSTPSILFDKIKPAPNLPAAFIMANILIHFRAENKTFPDYTQSDKWLSRYGFDKYYTYFDAANAVADNPDHYIKLVFGNKFLNPIAFTNKYKPNKPKKHQTIDISIVNQQLTNTHLDVILYEDLIKISSKKAKEINLNINDSAYLINNNNETVKFKIIYHNKHVALSLNDKLYKSNTQSKEIFGNNPTVYFSLASLLEAKEIKVEHDINILYV